MEPSDSTYFRVRDCVREFTTNQLIDLKLVIHGLLLEKAREIRDFDGIMEASYGQDSEG